MLRATRRRGVTLIELVVTLAILGVALMAAVPSIREWINNLAVRNAAESMKSGLERARSEAVRRNTPVTFWLVADSSRSLTNACVLSGSGPSWVVALQDPAGQCGAEPSVQAAPFIVDRWAVSEGARGAEVTSEDNTGAAADRVEFNSLGQVRRDAGQIVQLRVTHPGGGARPLLVRVEAGGGVRMCDPAVAADDPRRC